MKIFISYNHQDKEFVRRLSSDLRKGGFSVWLDEDVIFAGEIWADKIADALDHSDVILVVLSENSSNSNFQSSEIAYALASQRKNPAKRVIPIVINRKAELPFFLKDIVYADFSNPEDYSECFRQLGNTLSLSLPQETSTRNADQRKIEAIKAQKEYLRLESESLEKQQAVWSSIVLTTVASGISGMIAFIAGTIASAKLITVFFQQWGDFISGLLVGVLASLAAFFLSQRVVRKSLNKEVGDGK
ncbi:MAG: toll/interleukin-1 receptor domain-containing protein [Candidatus Contendobacter sp.]|nr:toll/interleukin-1 receptor domain-containing protein [Candidatus Contendobacter sp.]MDG4556672.1 toll/interleukin-1 receptor domain-containing protein [Candidatus Contendobacter sp.]